MWVLLGLADEPILKESSALNRVVAESRLDSVSLEELLTKKELGV